LTHKSTQKNTNDYITYVLHRCNKSLGIIKDGKLYPILHLDRIVHMQHHYFMQFVNTLTFTALQASNF